MGRPAVTPDPRDRDPQHRLGMALHDEGLLPPNCTNVEIHVGVDHAVMIRYEVFATAEDLGKIQRAIAATLQVSE